MADTLRRVEVEAADGTRGVVTIAAGGAPDRPIVLVIPAMGVRASWYRSLAAPLAREGLRLAVVEWRGHGESPVRPSRQVSWGYRELVEIDLPAAVQAVAAAYPDAPRVLLGHSLGGQLGAVFLATHPDAARGLVGVAACSVHWRAFPGPLSAGVLVFTAFARAVSAVLGVFPGDKVGFAGREAGGLVRDWAHQGRTGEYRGVGSALDYEAALAACPRPVLLLSLAGDDGMAPHRAVEHLGAKLADARCVHVDHPRIRALRRPHFEWVGETGPLLDVIGPWVREVVA